MTDLKTDSDLTAGRRRGDRRKRQVSIPFPDRRKSERRSGEDRRSDPRVS